MEGSASSDDLKENSFNKTEEEEGDDKANPKNSASSSNSTVEDSEKKTSSSGVRLYVRSKVPRLRWTPDLHNRFINAVERLGGQERATPKLLLQLMNVKGLSIAHVKSHLQMYRSKKMDDQEQVVNHNGFLIETGDRHIHNSCQLPMLRSFNHRPTSNFRWSDHVNWMPNSFMRDTLKFRVGPGFYGPVAERIFAATSGHMPHRDFFVDHSTFTAQTSKNSTYEFQDEFNMLYDGESCRTKTRASLIEPNFITQLQARGRERMRYLDNTSSPDNNLMRMTREKQKMIKRKAVDCNLDLNLSLNATSKQLEEWQKGCEEEEIDSNLSLSLFSPSKKGKYSIDLNQNSKISRLEEDDDSRKNSRMASTLDLTI